jgi:recombination protein RecT
MQNQPRPAAPAAQTRQSQAPGKRQAPPPQITPQELLDRILEEQSTQGMRLVNDALDLALERIQALLPEKLRGEGRRFIRRAKFYFSADKKLMGCTPESLLRCVLEAAEAGLPLDGRLAHAVPFWSTELRGFEAQFIADYKGEIAVARRNGRIKDAYARIVHEGESFHCGHKDGRDQLWHREDARRKDGPVVGAYVVIQFPDGSWRYDFMSLGQLLAIKERSKSKTKDGRIVGPWATDELEMMKKTVVRRGLKTYVDDEDLERLHRLEERAGAAEPPAAAEGFQAAEPGEEPYSPPPRSRIATGARPPAPAPEDNGSGAAGGAPAAAEATPEVAAEAPEAVEEFPSEAFAILDVAISGAADEDACMAFFNQIEAAAQRGALRSGEREELVRRWSARMNGFRKAALAAEEKK